MKIALVSPYDFSYPGGVANHISNLEYQFTRMGHVVKIIAPASGNVEGYGDRFIRIGKPRPVPSSGSIARITLSLTLKDRVKEVLDREKFDIIHMHEPLVPTLGFTVLRLSQSVNIGTFHAAESRPSYRLAGPLMVSGLYKKWFKKLDGRIAVSPPARDFINKYYPSNYEIIPNGVDINHFSPEVPALPEFKDDKVNILFLGRAEKRKGLEYLLKAYALIKPDLPACRLIIVSRRSRSRKKYEDYVEETGLPDVVFVDGSKVDDNLKPRYYSTADIFCSPATGHESQGIVLLEAMATGKPVVASSISGYASVITDGEEGLLVPPKQEVPLAQALSTLIKNETLRREIGQRGRERSAAYGWEFVSRKVMDYYTRILISRAVRV
jgi:phosphatidylinositol alpha-mannosyltransferase